MHLHVLRRNGSLALSLSTGFLAFSILCAGALSERFGRRVLIFASMTLAALLNICAALEADWQSMLVARALEDLALGGVPAVAMAYLAEEIDPRGLGLAMGLYVCVSLRQSEGVSACARIRGQDESGQ